MLRYAYLPSPYHPSVAQPPTGSVTFKMPLSLPWTSLWNGGHPGRICFQLCVARKNIAGTIPPVPPNAANALQPHAPHATFGMGAVTSSSINVHGDHHHHHVSSSDGMLPAGKTKRGSLPSVLSIGQSATTQPTLGSAPAPPSSAPMYKPPKVLCRWSIRSDDLVDRSWTDSDLFTQNTIRPHLSDEGEKGKDPLWHLTFVRGFNAIIVCTVLYLICIHVTAARLETKVEAFWHHKTGPNVHHESYVISNKPTYTAVPPSTTSSNNPATSPFPDQQRYSRRVSGPQIVNVVMCSPEDTSSVDGTTLRKPSASDEETITSAPPTTRAASTSALPKAAASLLTTDSHGLSCVVEGDRDCVPRPCQDASMFHHTVGSVLLSRLNESDCAVVVPRLLLPYIFR